MHLRPELKKAVVIATGLLLAITLVWAVAARGAVYELRVDGQLIGFIENMDSVKSAVDSLLSAESTKRGLDLMVASEITTTKATAGSDSLNGSELQGALAKVLTYCTKACAIVVNGEVAVALKDKAEAESVLASIKSDFEQSIKKTSGATIATLQILEDVKVEDRPVDLSEIRAQADAKQLLLRGTDHLVTYSVKSGDSLWTIARANSMTVDSLRIANPELKSDRINIGQKLSLTVAKPYINIVSVEKQVSEVRIAFRTETREDPDLWPWESVIRQHGVSGKKEVTYEIKRQNGREIARTVLDEKHISDPTTQIVSQGSKMVADLGTGQYAWPVGGAGKITSRYGPRRSGYHSGLDIAAPTGTPVRAADSGTVTTASYKAYYGNMIIIDHGGGRTITVYGHLSKILVKVGQVVEKGDVIGNVGSTGRSTGPHLHFEVRVEGSTQNPIKYYPIDL